MDLTCYSTISFMESATATTAQIYIPVSYTHLDVYKRQIVGGIVGFYSAKYGVERLAGSMKSAGAFFGKYVSGWILLAIAVITPICLLYTSMFLYILLFIVLLPLIYRGYSRYGVRKK